jgi:cystathionine gamma-synthase
VPDLRAVVKCCKQAKPSPVLIVDSTFATPYCLKPLVYGADIVIHSLTKYLAGHDDLLAGCVCGSSKYLDKICSFRDVLGGICDPHNTFLCMRSLKTFAVRMERINENGFKVAKFLEKHPKVIRLYYPGLSSHPDYSVSRRLLKGYGSVLYFEIKGGSHATRKFISNLRLPFIGTNFGGVHTFIEPFSKLTFGKLTKKERAKLGIGENLIRMCIGLENVSDIINDLKRALNLL